METLYQNEDYSPELFKTKEVQELVDSTYKVLCSALDEGITTQIPPAMRYRLENSVFMFSGFKTMHELREASTLMRDGEGNVKSFDKFSQDILSIHDKYNVNYLRAEYNFAVSSSQMAARWEALGDDEDTILQYRTAKDDHVRAEHRPLDGVTLPKKNGFWNSYYPPNDWGCRCTVVEVLGDDYPMSDTDEAESIGNRALNVRGKKSEMFRFNPGKEKRIFPPKHPYFCRQMGSCGKVALASSKNTPFCSACYILQQVRQE